MKRRGPLHRLIGVAHELSVVRMFTRRHWPRLLVDILLYRLMRLGRIPGENGTRTVQMLDGTWLTYRLNRGDIQGIREIWLDEVYKPPPEATSAQQVVDLGANIGFTCLYLYKRLDAPHIIAVEPDPANVAILRRNLEQNHIPASIVDAAVGPYDGQGAFLRDRESNLGQLHDKGDMTVRVVSMPSVIGRLPDPATRTLLKLDIEGGEDQLFTGDLSWLGRFDFLLAELHPTRADQVRIESLIEGSGLHFRPGGGPGEPPACWVRANGAGQPARDGPGVA